MSPLRSNIAVLLSERTRQSYAAEAQATGETYSFTGAQGRERKWLKGEFAYLGPSALTSMLHRWGLKHDLINDDHLLNHLSEYSTLFLAGAGNLSDAEISAITGWLDLPESFLVVSGRTNLPGHTLGLAEIGPIRPCGYTGWEWTPESPFCDSENWAPVVVSSYQGYQAARARARSEATVLARLVEITGDLASAEAATIVQIGDGIVSTERTIYVANNPFEYLGGVLQAHLSVEEVRTWVNPTCWGDMIAFQLRELLRRSPARRLWNITLSPFGAYQGVLQLRHDVDHEENAELDFSMLEVEVRDAVPATYYVMDTNFCKTRCTEIGGKIWMDRLARHNFLEVGQHNDSVEGDPPSALIAEGLHDHIAASDLTMGTKSRSAGRHMGFLVYPETIDAMAYLYDENEEILGLCTFSLYDVIEYGVRNPDVVRLGKQITYSTYDHANPKVPAAISGYWFPYHPVMSTTDEQRILRGWDVTHDTDCDFERIETLLDGSFSKRRDSGNHLENGVFTIQYEPQLGMSPRENNGAGHLPWLRYAIAHADRQNFWITTKQALYERMNDYQDVTFRVESERRLVVQNPTDRTIEGLTIRLHQAGKSLMAGEEYCIHITPGMNHLLPAIGARETVVVHIGKGNVEIPQITQQNNRFVEITEANYHPSSRRISVRGKSIRGGYVVVQRLLPGAVVVVTAIDNRGQTRTRYKVDGNGDLAIRLFAQQDNVMSFAFDLEAPHIGQDIRIAQSHA
jgi:hypothetical protein